MSISENSRCSEMNGRSFCQDFRLGRRKEGLVAQDGVHVDWGGKMLVDDADFIGVAFHDLIQNAVGLGAGRTSKVGVGDDGHSGVVGAFG